MISLGDDGDDFLQLAGYDDDDEPREFDDGENDIPTASTAERTDEAPRKRKRRRRSRNEGSQVSAAYPMSELRAGEERARLPAPPTSSHVLTEQNPLAQYQVPMNRQPGRDPLGLREFFVY